MSTDVQDQLARIRAATVEKKADFPHEIVEIEEGVKVEVRALTFKEAGKVKDGLTNIVVTDDSMTKQEALQEGKFDVDFDQNEYSIRLLLKCCFAPGTNTRVFTKEDRAIFEEQPAHKGHWLSRLIDTATELNNAGNSKATPSD